MVVVLAEAVPTVDEYCALRILTGWSAMDPGAAVDALPRSFHAVTLRHDAQLVGRGRAVDIAVHPDAQGQRLSHMIMENIMKFVHSLPSSTIVNLFADIDWLHQKFGFVVPENATSVSLRRGA